MGSLKEKPFPANSTNRSNLATMEDLSDVEDEDRERPSDLFKMPRPTAADLEVSPIVLPSNEYDYPDYCKQRGIKRYYPFLKGLVASRIPEREKEMLPLDRVGFCSFITYHWMTGILWSLYRNGASAMKSYRCTIFESCHLNSQRLEYLWKEEVKRNGSKAELSAAVAKFIRTRMLWSAGLFTLGLSSGFVTPVFFLYKLMEFVNDENAPLTDGLMYILLIALVEVTRMFIFSYQWAINMRTALRIRTAILGIVFKKLVHLNNLGNKSVGEIINLFANDSARILEYTLLGHLWFGGTITIVFSLAYVFWVLGLPAFACVGVFISFYLIMFVISKLLGYYRRKAVQTSDQRVRQMTEILNCMKIIKLYAWEEPFMKTTTEIRNRERGYLEKMVFLQSFGTSSSNSVPIVAAIASFMLCFALGKPLNPAVVFSILGALLMTRGGLMILPVTAGKIAEFRSAIGRMQGVLQMENQCMVTSTPKDPNHAVIFRNTSFAWNSPIEETAKKSEKLEECEKKSKKKKRMRQL